MALAATASSNATYNMDAMARTSVSRANNAQTAILPQSDETKQYLKDMEMPKPSEQTLAKSAFYRPTVWSAKITPMAMPRTQAATPAQTATPSAQAPPAGAQTPVAAANAPAQAAPANAATQPQSSEKSAAIKPSTGCKTCQTRQYKDGSDDAGVSFQSASHVPAATAAISVASHEGEHVSRNSDKAQREDRVVIRKTVTFQMAFCPECHKMYVAGGTTSMTTAAASKPTANAEVTKAKDLFGGSGDNVDTFI